MKPYRFIQTEKGWYIHLPEYIEQGGVMGDLQMVDGADTMLDIMSEGKSAVIVSISSAHFDGADLLTLTEICDPAIGGGYYLMKKYESREINKSMWLCQVTEFVFGRLPEQIFVRREK